MEQTLPQPDGNDRANHCVLDDDADGDDCALEADGDDCILGVGAVMTKMVI